MKTTRREEYFSTALREELTRRQRANPSYSLRAFARHLEMQPATLSAVISNKRPLSRLTAQKLPEKLTFSPSEKRRFLNSVYFRKSPEAFSHSLEENDDAKILNEELHYKIIAEWEHYAVLTLADTHGFKPHKKWIAKRLNISEVRAQTTLEHLQQAGLISIDARGRARLQQNKVNTVTDVPSTALRQAHREALNMGIEKLEKVPVGRRDFSSITIAVNPDRLPEAKKLIRSFQKKLSSLMEDGKRTEVYQMCMQLYPLTEMNREKGDLE